MVSFEQVRRSARADNRVHRGRRLVEASKSVGRHREFDRRFMPTKANPSKWKRVDRAFRNGIDLVPVSLYRIGDSYFVHDGNHRVSVGRFHGVEWMNAVVTEFRPRLADAVAVASRAWSAA
jgi:hypothetical protein